MQGLKILIDIEKGFVNVLKSLTPGEFEFNRQLLGKTKKVASLLACVTQLRKENPDQETKERTANK